MPVVQDYPPGFLPLVQALPTQYFAFLGLFMSLVVVLNWV